jgi:hypothetical protein
METGLLHLHNILRWVILLALLITLFQAFTKNKAVAKSSLILMITAHIMLLIGLYQVLLGSNWGFFGSATFPEDSSVMKDPVRRFFQIEHPLTMIIAVVLITIARRKAKVLQYGKVSLFLILALGLILIRVPWPFMEYVGRPWFPGA